MADETSDVTELVDAAVGCETDERDEVVLENPVAPKKFIFSAETAGDYQYGPRLMSYIDLKKQSKPDNGFDIMAAMINFKPASVNPQRLFSYGRISKNDLQNQLSPANHDRNVLLSKNQHLINCSK